MLLDPQGLRVTSCGFVKRLVPRRRLARARAALARNIQLTPAKWPSTYYNYRPERPEDYLVFTVGWPGETPHCGGSRYVAVHKITGVVLDLGEHGE